MFFQANNPKLRQNFDDREDAKIRWTCVITTLYYTAEMLERLSYKEVLGNQETDKYGFSLYFTASRCQ